MKKTFIITMLCLYLSSKLFSQANCSSPVQVDICPSVYLTGQTNAGMGDDATAPCNIAGEDVVYEIFAPNGAQQIYISIVNASSPMNLYMEQSNCGTGICSSYSIPAGNRNLTFNVTSANYYYLWIDAAGIVTYDIAIGGDTGSVWVNIPDTQGNLRFDSSFCATPPFYNTKPFYQVSYNGVFKTHPMTLSPLNIPGVLCVSTFFKNLTGNEGVKRFIFHFNPGGFSNISASPSIAGFYNPGNWLTSNLGNDWYFTFVDSAGTSRGDFTGSPNSCLLYEFCFNLTPLNNNPVLTNVTVDIISDGYGQGYTGLISSGCCPGPFANCIYTGGLGGGGGGANAFGFGFDDPGGGTLPIELLLFDAQLKNNEVELTWTTALEINNDFFTIERSRSGNDWMPIDQEDGAGNSTIIRNYKTTDQHPLHGVSFYHLKQTDFNGAFTYSDVKKIYFKINSMIQIYPNPVNDLLTIEIAGDPDFQFLLYNSMGEKVIKSTSEGSTKTVLKTSSLNPGLYLLVIEQSNEIIKEKRIVIQRK